MAGSQLTRTEIETLAVALEGEAPAKILAWASRVFGLGLTFSTGFGPEGCMLIDLIGRARLPVDLLTLDTGLLFPETYALWRRLESRYGLIIRRVSPQLTVDAQSSLHGPALWARHPDRCCEMRKVEPLRGELSRFDAWITGIRRNQTSARATARVVEWDDRFGLVKVNPLVRMTSTDIWRHLRDYDVPVNPLHEQDYPSIGCMPCTSPIADGEHTRAGRWRGLTKIECGLHGRSETLAAALSNDQ